jgi:cytoskeletal protein CcmA (bactofilin family)
MSKDRPIAGPGTVVGSNVVLTGILRDAGDVAIHGKIEGEITSERTILIGETAEIKGPISGQIITVAGFVKGSIDAGQKLEIMPTGKVYGSISTRELIIRSGAIFVGKSTMPVEDEVADTGEEELDESAKSDIHSFDSVGQAVIEDE